MFPGVVVKGIGYVMGAKSGQNGGVKHQLAHMFRILGNKAAAGHCAPAPAKHVYLLLLALANDSPDGCGDILGSVVGVGHKAVTHFSGGTVAGDVQAPYSVSLCGQETGQAVVGIVNVEFMGGIGQPVHKQNLFFRGCVCQRHAFKVQFDAIAFQADIFLGERQISLEGICLRKGK